MTDAAKSESVTSVPKISAEPASSAIAAAAADASSAAPDRAKDKASIGSIGASRYALLIGGLGFAAGIGLLAGSVGIMGAGHIFASPSTAPAPWASVAGETRALKQNVTRLEAQVAALKSSIEKSGRQATTQRSQITARHEQNAKTQTEMQARLGKIGDAIERLEKRVTAAVAAEATGSVAPKYAATAAATPPKAVEPPPPAKPPVAQGWIISRVMRGRALVVNRHGMYEAAPGTHLPGLGRVEAITRENGRWAVITEKGIITTLWRPRRDPELVED
jgi:TolA-binding protein